MIRSALLVILIAAGWIAFMYAAIVLVDWLAMRFEAIGEML